MEPSATEVPTEAGSSAQLSRELHRSNLCSYSMRVGKLIRDAHYRRRRGTHLCHWAAHREPFGTANARTLFLNSVSQKDRRLRSSEDSKPSAKKLWRALIGGTYCADSVTNTPQFPEGSSPMGYRDFTQPVGHSSPKTAADWIQWANREGIAPSVAPTDGSTCQLCHGAVGERGVGAYWNFCQNCNKGRRTLDAVVPVAYSIDSGLESVLHRYKDFTPSIHYRWMALPLASLAIDFLSAHLRCIERAYGSPQLGIIMPSSNTNRDFNHMEVILGAAASWPIQWTTHLLYKAKPGRPSRGEIDSSYYAVVSPAAIRGRNIVLFDDTWTSGATAFSAAARLREAGAHSVVSFTIGRQLRDDWGTGHALTQRALSRSYSKERCVICAQRS